MPNPFVHVELNTGDLTAAKKFYRRLFGWKLENHRMGPGMVYTMVDPGKNKHGIGGGMQKKPMAEAPTMWLSYVLVDDVKKTMAKAAKAGAQIHVEYMEIPNGGSFGIFTDPTGATLGVWQEAPKKRATRAKPAAKPAAKKKAAKPAAKKKAARV